MVQNFKQRNVEWRRSQVKGELREQIAAAAGKIGALSDRLQVQGTTTDIAAATLAALLEKVTALNKNISSIQGHVNRWKEQEQQFAAEDEEMDNIEDAFPAFSSTLVIDSVTDSTSR